MDKARALGLGAAHGIGCAADGAGQAADADGAPRRQILVRPVHSVGRVGFGDVCRRIGLGEDVLAARDIRRGSASRLVLTGGSGAAQSGGVDPAEPAAPWRHGAEPQRTPCGETDGALVDQSQEGFFRPRRQFSPHLLRQLPVPRETTGLAPHNRIPVLFELWDV